MKMELHSMRSIRFCSQGNVCTYNYTLKIYAKHLAGLHVAKSGSFQAFHFFFLLTQGKKRLSAS